MRLKNVNVLSSYIMLYYVTCMLVHLAVIVLPSAKRHLSSKIDVVDDDLDQMRQLTASTKNEVNLLHGDTSLVQIDVESVSRAVSNLKLKMDQLDEGQNFAGRGLYALCKFAEGWQQGMIKGPVKTKLKNHLLMWNCNPMIRIFTHFHEEQRAHSQMMVEGGCGSSE